MAYLDVTLPGGTEESRENFAGYLISLTHKTRRSPVHTGSWVRRLHIKQRPRQEKHETRNCYYGTHTEMRQLMQRRYNTVTPTAALFLSWQQ